MFPVPAPGLGFPVVVEELLLVLRVRLLHLLLHPTPTRGKLSEAATLQRLCEGSTRGIFFPWKELGKEEQFVHSPRAVSDSLAHIQGQSTVPGGSLGLASPAAPEELVLGVLTNKQWQEATRALQLDT